MTEFIKGMDISFTDEIESEGGTFYENGVEKDIVAIMKDSGVNSIRLRLWNEPEANYVNLERTKLMAKRIKEAGLHFLLDFHYSDYWADPAKQTKPKAWAKLAFPELVEAVRSFTRETLLALKEQGTLPDMVQIGNEITPGMLWDEGKVDGEFNTDEQWDKFSTLVKAGIEGAHEAAGADSGMKIMIHIDRGADNESSRYFLDRFKQLDVQYDVIGQSYYPWWHGTLQQVADNLNDLALRYDKDIIIVETAYPWTLSNEERPIEFIVTTEDQLHEGYPATVEGQARFLADLASLIKQTPNGRGVGLYYWEPGWIPSKEQWSVGHANNWSNLTLFDFAGNKLKSLDV